MLLIVIDLKKASGISKMYASETNNAKIPLLKELTSLSQCKKAVLFNQFKDQLHEEKKYSHHQHCLNNKTSFRFKIKVVN